MKVIIELPDNYAEFLKEIANLKGEDPEAFVKEYCEYWITDVIRGSLDTIGSNSLFSIEELITRYKLGVITIEP